MDRFKIPKVIYKTAPSLNSELQHLFLKIEIENPGWRIKFYNDENCLNFLKNKFSKFNLKLKNDVINCYNNLVPPAYKADLWRLCVIYEYGGVYSDATQRFLKPIEEIFDFNKEINMIKDKYKRRGKKIYIGLQIGLFSAPKKHPFLLKYIQEIILNVKNKFYGISCLSPTGPLCAFKVALRYNYLNKINIPLAQFKRCYKNKKGEIVVLTKLESHNQIIKKTKANHYYTLWSKKKIYK